ncbi:uncharacterized protein TNCV_4630051 [Trichonephila clavipes]|nr:uncharacterized protein TNCV_4630051 [Trichonephila clavipes]
MKIGTGSSDSNSSRYKSSNFESVQRKSNESQYGRMKESGVKRELEEKGISFLIKIRRCRGEEIVMPSTSGCNLQPRRGAKVESRPTNMKKTQQGEPVRSRGSREH